MASVFQSFLAGEQGRRAQEGFESQQALRQQAMQQQQAGFSQDQALLGAQVLQRVVDRAKQIPDPAQRLQMFEQARPALRQFEVALPEQLSVQDVTDEGLVPLETGLGQALQQAPMTGPERQRQSLLRVP